MTTRYFVGKGKLLIGDRTPTGQPTNLQWLGNVPQLAIATTEENLDHKESYTGLNLRDKQISIAQSASATFMIEEFKKDNLIKFLTGEGTVIAPGAIEGESHLAYPNSYIQLRNGNVSESSLAITVGTQLIENYTLEAKSGLIYFPATFPGGTVNVDYSYDAMDQVSAFTAKKKEYYMFFAGLNLADDSSPVLVDIYKFKPNSPANMNFIGDEFLQMEITGEILFDSARATNYPQDGGFFKIRQNPEEQPD